MRPIYQVPADSAESAKKIEKIVNSPYKHAFITRIFCTASTVVRRDEPKWTVNSHDSNHYAIPSKFGYSIFEKTQQHNK